MTAAGPFSYAVNVGHVSTNALHVTIEADDKECRDLAAFWGVNAVHSFSASLDLSRWKRDGVRVAGTVSAVIEQACIVTLEPVTQQIDEPLDALYVPEGSKLERLAARLDDNGEMRVDPEGPDAPEPFSGDKLDVGAIAAEFAALAIDPFPRKPGVRFEGHVESDPEDDPADSRSPFKEALKDWANKKN